jgi:hypothetical protein
MQVPAGLRQQHALRQRGPTRSQRASSMRMAASRSLVRELQQQVAGGQRAAVDVTREYLERLRSVEGQVANFITVDEEAALAQVRAAGRSRALTSRWRRRWPACDGEAAALVQRRCTRLSRPHAAAPAAPP